MINCNMWRYGYIIFKAGESRDRARNSGQFNVPKDLVIFTRQAIKIRDCPEKIGTGDGHLKLDTLPEAGAELKLHSPVDGDCIVLSGDDVIVGMKEEDVEPRRW